MKKLIRSFSFGLLTILGLCLTVSAGSFSPVSANLGCGLKPLKPLTPLGCRDTQGVCICNSNGNCYWQWICLK